MKLFSKIFRMDISITMKLLFLNLMIFIVFGVIIGVMVLAFRDIESLTSKIIDKDVKQILDNARLSKDFSLVFDRTCGLVGAFYKNTPLLETEGDALLKETARLSAQNMDPNLKKSLDHFKTKLESLFKQCSTINDISAKIQAINKDLTMCFSDLDNTVSENLILLVTKGRDTASLEQISVLISSYEKNLLKISLCFTELETMRSGDKDPMSSLLELLDDLQLRLRMLLAESPEISQYGHKVIEGILAYKQESIAFNQALREFRARLSELNQAKAGIIVAMEDVNANIMDKFGIIREENKSVMRDSMDFVYALSGTVIILFGIFTYIFFLLNIRKPMETICKALEFVGDGDMDARIRLDRNDEWSVIEEAINRMVGEIWNSYSELYRKNEELQKIHTELEASAKYLEAEIAERKRTEEKLWKSQRYIKNIIDSMPSVMIGIDTEGRITHWNMAAEKAVGAAMDDVLNKMITEVYPELSAHMERVQMSLSDFKPLKASKKIRRVQDEIRYEDIMIYPLIANGVEGAVIRVDDVTERVRIEEMMIQTEKMMSVGGLAAGMAHEINNPLGAILQGVQNAFRRLSHELEANLRTAEECGTDLETIRAYLEKRGIFRYLDGIRESGLRAARIVSNMLNFSRQSAADMSLSDINKLLDSTLELATSDYDLKKRYDFRQIRIIRDYDDELPPTPCIPTEIEQVVLNLLRNSAQAMAEIKNKRTDAPIIILRTRKTSEYLLIEVEDNGPGMEEKIRHRIFEPFFTTKAVGVGTGLGLSVSYFIITNNHKGSISVESEFGKGTKFIIRLPLQRTGQ